MRIIAIILTLAISSAALADVIMLKNGTRIEGDIKHTDDGYDVTAPDGKVTHLSTSSVESIQLGGSASATAASAMDRLASLRRSADQLDNLPQIIDRYQRFVDQNKNTPAAAAAQKDMVMWQDRRDKQMVKVAGKWVSPEEHDRLAAQAGDVAKDAYDLMKANKLAEAEPVIKNVLALDPQNVAANYLLGVLLYRHDQLMPARKAFETAHAAAPSDAATLNNLGVIVWRQNQFITALGFYDDAMLAMPANKEILGNVSEALAALKDEFKKTPVAQRVSRRFIEQESQLETQMAQYGWYRWGSVWLDKSQLNELKKGEQEFKDKADAMQKQYDALKAKIRDNKDKIVTNQRAMDDMLANSTFVDTRGQTYRNPLPDLYYQLQRDNARFDVDNDSIARDMTQMQEVARRLEASKPQPKFTGIQQIIGVEGTPGMNARAPQPSTQSSTPPTTQPTSQATSQPATEPATPIIAQPNSSPASQPTTDRVF